MSSCSTRSLLNTGTYQYIPVTSGHSCTFQYILLCTSMYLYVLVRTVLYLTYCLVVDGTLTTFGCVEWESEQFRGVMRARCYPFKLPKRCFHGVNPQVYKLVYTIIYMYIHVYTSTYIYQYVLVCTNIYQYIPLSYQYMPVHTSTY